ncbi:MAG: hypothetical protein WAX80_02125 [Minisyncoccia bacterium]
MDESSNINKEQEVLIKPKRKKSTLTIIILAVLILISAVSTAGYFYLQSKKQDESKNILDQVSKLIILPQDEQPTIATITDLEQLKDQEFFANAEVGDKVIIYTKAKKAILYRPSENKIVEVAPLNLDSGQ